MADVTVALPVCNLDLAAPAPTTTSDVEYGLPTASLNLAAPAPWIGTRKPLDRVTADLYDVDGLTRIGSVRHGGGTWQHELSKPGSVTFRALRSDPVTAELTPRRIVKFTWWRAGVGVATFACRLTSESGDLAVDGNQWVTFDTQPGLLSLLGDAVVAPEYGLEAHSTGDRFFGFMSEDGNWRLDGNWLFPQGYPMSAETGHRRGHPSGLLAYDPDWIAYLNPTTHVSARTVNYFRAEIPCTAGTDIEIDYTADNFFTLYLDGEQLYTPDYSNAGQWMHTVGITARTTRDNPILAAKVENAPLAHSAGWNPMGLVGVVFEIDNNGNRASTLLQTDTSSAWRVHDNTPEPGWFAGQVLRKLMLEAQARTVDGPTRLTLGFTDYHDTDGGRWADTTSRGEYILPVATSSYVDIVAQLSETDIDVDVDPVTMRLNAWARKGADKTATVVFTVGGNLTQHAYDTAYGRFTSVLTQRQDGSWLNIEDTAVIAAIGVVEAGLTLDSTTQESTAIAAVRAQMRESAQPQTSITSQASTLDGGPIPYVDFDIGDTGTVTGPNATTLAARALAITVDFTVDVVKAWVEQLEDVTA